MDLKMASLYTPPEASRTETKNENLTQVVLSHFLCVGHAIRRSWKILGVMPRSFVQFPSRITHASDECVLLLVQIQWKWWLHPLFYSSRKPKGERVSAAGCKLLLHFRLHLSFKLQPGTLSIDNCICICNWSHQSLIPGLGMPWPNPGSASGFRCHSCSWLSFCACGQDSLSQSYLKQLLWETSTFCTETHVYRLRSQFDWLLTQRLRSLGIKIVTLCGIWPSFGPPRLKTHQDEIRRAVRVSCLNSTWN